MLMEKNKILSKLNINIKDYNNELEKILENKLFSYDVKNLLLSMLYKIENAYKDYEVVKVDVPNKKEYIENLFRIIREKALKIFLVKVGTDEAKELEEKGVSYKVDKENGEIVCFQNERVILRALLTLNGKSIMRGTEIFVGMNGVTRDMTNTSAINVFNYVDEPLNEMIEKGRIDSEVEVMRDFNGWAWDIVTKEIENIEYNFLYQNLMLLNEVEDVHNLNGKMNNLITKMTIEKYISCSQNKEYKEKFEEIRNSKRERLVLFENKKEFLNKITEEKKNYTKEIERIDKILNDNELLKKEYYARNEELPNKEKIFSVSYLVGILEKERASLLESIEECNKLILPKEFVAEKERLTKEVEFLNSISEEVKREDFINVCEAFLENAKTRINKVSEQDKVELIKWIYRIRCYRYLPINENEFVKDIKELDETFEKLIKRIIKRAQSLKIWDSFSEDANLTYEISKEIFNTKIINLETINMQFKYENKELYVEYFDDTVIENSLKVHIDGVKIKKKVKLFV